MMVIVTLYTDSKLIITRTRMKPLYSAMMLLAFSQTAHAVFFIPGRS